MCCATSRPSRIAQTTRLAPRDDVAGGEHTVDARHHRAPVGAQRAPARDAELGLAEHPRQILGIEAERLDHEIGAEIEFVARIGLGRAAAAGVGRAQPHPRDAHAAYGHAVEALGRREPDELYAFLLGVGDFARRSRHVGAVAAIEALHRFGALANGGAHAIHRRVAAADHHHALAQRIEAAAVEFGDCVAEALAVRCDQIVERLDHARRIDPPAP